MKSLRALSFGFLISASASAASLLQPGPSDQKVEGASIVKSVTVNVDGKAASVVRAGHALRRKKVAVFWAKVYVAEIFAPSAKELDRSSGEAFTDSLLKQKLFVLRLTFLRDVSAQKTLSGLKDGMEANGTDPNSAAVKPVFDAVSQAGENQDGRSLWVVGAIDANGDEKAWIEGAHGRVQALTVEKGVLRKVLMIWLGKPADGGLEEFKSALLSSAPAAP